MTISRQATGQRNYRHALPLERPALHAWAIYVSRLVAIIGICAACVLSAWVIGRLEWEVISGLVLGGIVAVLSVIPCLKFDLLAK